MGSAKKSKKDGIHGKIFVNLNNETLLCRGRLQFLELVDKCGSISQAARQMDWSYRKAWGLIEKTNRSAGRIIVETQKGGTGGGGAYLTQDGKKLINLYRAFLEENRQLTDAMWIRFNQEFPPQAQNEET